MFDRDYDQNVIAGKWCQLMYEISQLYEALKTYTKHRGFDKSVIPIFCISQETFQLRDVEI